MHNSARHLAKKVPEITAIFWVTKVLTTAMGESTSDYFVLRYNPYLTVILGGVVLAIALALQFSTRRYTAWVYWLTVAMVAVFGTMAADVLHIQFHVPYVASTVFFAVVLAVVFWTWQRVEHTLSIHSITSPRRELFYWATVLATFALGTAAGDWTAVSLGLGYFTSGLLFTGLMIIPVVLYRSGFSRVASFWLAYILTRPLGASFADWLGKPASAGGRGWGDGPVSLLLTGLIVLCVLYMTFDRREARRETSQHRGIIGLSPTSGRRSWPCQSGECNRPSNTAAAYPSSASYPS